MHAETTLTPSLFFALQPREKRPFSSPFSNRPTPYPTLIARFLPPSPRAALHNLSIPRLKSVQFPSVPLPTGDQLRYGGVARAIGSRLVFHVARLRSGISRFDCNLIPIVQCTRARTRLSVTANTIRVRRCSCENARDTVKVRATTIDTHGSRSRSRRRGDEDSEFAASRLGFSRSRISGPDDDSTTPAGTPSFHGRERATARNAARSADGRWPLDR